MALPVSEMSDKSIPRVFVKPTFKQDVSITNSMFLVSKAGFPIILNELRWDENATNSLNASVFELLITPRNSFRTRC